MSFSTKHALRLALVTTAALSMAACASKPKPGPGVGPGPGPGYPSQPGPGPGVGAVVPGSIQDFVVNIGDRVYFDFDQYDIRADAGPVLDAQSQWLMHK